MKQDTNCLSPLIFCDTHQCHCSYLALLLSFSQHCSLLVPTAANTKLLQCQMTLRIIIFKAT